MELIIAILIAILILLLALCFIGNLICKNGSGKEGQFSDSDKKTAENFDIDYMDVNDFIKMI